MELRPRESAYGMLRLLHRFEQEHKVVYVVQVIQLRLTYLFEACILKTSLNIHNELLDDEIKQE